MRALSMASEMKSWMLPLFQCSREMPASTTWSRPRVVDQMSDHERGAHPANPTMKQPLLPFKKNNTRLVEFLEVGADEGQLHLRVQALDRGVVRPGDEVEAPCRRWWCVG